MFDLNKMVISLKHKVLSFSDMAPNYYIGKKMRICESESRSRMSYLVYQMNTNFVYFW